MDTDMMIIYISAVWGILEILLALIKWTRIEDSNNLDRFSFKLLWITVSASLLLAVYFKIENIGGLDFGNPLLQVCGAILIMMGIIIRWSSVLTLRRYVYPDFAVSYEYHIIQKGFYGSLRHPAYAGSLISFLGLGLGLSNWISLLVLIIPTTSAFIYRAMVEDRKLAGLLGDDYNTYMDTTDRIIPPIL